MKSMKLHIHKRHLVRAGAVLLLTVTALWAAPPERTYSIAQAAYVPGEILVQYRRHVDHQTAAYHSMQAGSTLVRALAHTPASQGPIHQIRTRPNIPLAHAIAQIQNNPDVEYAQPNYIYRATVAPNDTSYGQLWGLKNTGQTISSPAYATNNPGTSGRDMDLETAWNTITDCSSVRVAVIDSGVNYNHEDLAGNMVSASFSCPGGSVTSSGCDFVGTGDGDPLDLNGHGTHVAATIGAVGNNSTGIAGVCWTAKIVAVRVLDAAGSGTTADIVEGLNFAAGTGAGQGQAKVVNMSLGGSSSDTAFNTAITTAQTNDVVVVVAAGNSNQNHNTTAGYPCDYTQSNIICVAAADQSYSRASFSDYDFNTTAANRKVDIAAPGTNIRSAYLITSTTTDDFSSGWTTSPSNAWSFTNCNLGSTVPLMGNPGSGVGTTWCSGGTVGNNRSDVVYKNFDLSSYSGYDYLGYSFYFWADLKGTTDVFTSHYKPGGGDPSSGGTTALTVTGLVNTGTFYSWTQEFTSCATSTCTIGFKLATDATANNTYDGIALAYVTITGNKVSNTTYGVLNGTSMASPHVAGIATMLRARNPNYTYTDVVNAIMNGGDAAAGFTSYTKSGKVADAYGSLKYIPDISGYSLVSP